MPARSLLEDQSAQPAPAIAITIPVRLIGLVVLGLVAVMMAALSSWSVDDPSFSYATSKPVANWLGFPGAVIADFSFQVLGLGIIVLLVPLALWGWSFVRRRVPSRMGLRFIAWFGASGRAGGVLTFLPAPASWPLPTGRGGLIGTGFSNLAAMVTGARPQPVTAWLFAIILMAPTFALFWIALGLGTFELPEAAAKGKGKSRAAGNDAPERTGIMDVAIGALVHLGFSTQTAFRRAIAQARANAAAKREAEAAEWRDGAAEPRLASRTPAVAVLPDERREPSLTVQRRIFTAPSSETIDEEEETVDEDELYADEPVEVPARAPRVTAPAKRPTPGARAARAAQGSLLEAT